MKVVIKTPDGRYVGGGRSAELVDRLSRAYVYDEEDDNVDAQIAFVNAMYNCGWYKVPVDEERRGKGREVSDG